MKFYLLCILGFLAITSIAFQQHKCEHIYVAVQSAEIKVEPLSFNAIEYYAEQNFYKSPSGKEEGKDLVCIKCFHQQKQILDYGRPKCLPCPTPAWPAIVTIGPPVGTLKIDSSFSK